MVQLLWKLHTVWQYLKKFNIYLMHDLFISIKNVYTNVHSSFICQLPKLETTQSSLTSFWVNKLWFLYPYNQITFSNKMEETINKITYITHKMWVIGTTLKRNAYCVVPFIWNSRKGKLIYGVSRKVVALRWWKGVCGSQRVGSQNGTRKLLGWLISSLFDDSVDFTNSFT